jgi:hypothetical protein
MAAAAQKALLEGAVALELPRVDFFAWTSRVPRVIATGLLAWLAFGPMFELQFGLWFEPMFGLRFGLVAGLLAWLGFGPLAGLGLGLTYPET